MPRFIVVQMGARRDYAIPDAFEQHGMLEALYTDLCATRGVGRLASHLAPWPLPMRRQLLALAARRPPAGVAGKTRTFDWPGLQVALARPAGTPVDDPRDIERYTRTRETLWREMIRAGCGNATHIYSMHGEGGSFLVEAKRRGLQIVSEVFIALSAYNIVRAEMCSFPGWCSDPFPGALDPRPVRYGNENMLATSDVFVCPSEFVRDDLVAVAGVAQEKTVVVPYMVGKQWLELDNRPEPGRVLFVGTADLRKGIHYLAMAADRLQARKRRYNFRIAGDAAPEVTRQPLCKNLTFLGRVPRTEIAAEFASADVLVLPSLAEGSAGATYEALGAGIPVITTDAAGSVVRNELEGLIVPARDAIALAQAIKRIVEDRDLRQRMAKAARARAACFAPDRVALRLIRELGWGDTSHSATP
jgi:glycosyltransferase involved in cell wall biosynthesis